MNAERVEMEEKDIGNNKCTKISHGYSRKSSVMRRERPQDGYRRALPVDVVVVSIYVC